MYAVTEVSVLVKKGVTVYHSDESQSLIRTQYSTIEELVRPTRSQSKRNRSRVSRHRRQAPHGAVRTHSVRLHHLYSTTISASPNSESLRRRTRSGSQSDTSSSDRFFRQSRSDSGSTRESSSVSEYEELSLHEEEQELEGAQSGDPHDIEKGQHERNNQQHATMKLVGHKNEVAYSSLDLELPASPPPMRRNTSGNSQISPSSSTMTIADTPGTSRSFFNTPTHNSDQSPHRRQQTEASRARFAEAPHEFYRSAVLDILRALEGPIQQLALEVKGALVATGFAAVCYLLSWFQAVLVPFFLAVFLMYLVDPLVEVIDVSPKYFLCICTSRGRHARRKSRGCSRAFASLCAVGIVCIFFGLLGYITVLSVHGLDVEAYQQGYNHLIEGVEGVLVRIGLPVNITTTLHDNVDKLARIVITQTMDLFSVMFVTIIYLTYFLCTRTRASDAGGAWSKIDQDIQRFVTLKAFLSLFVALLVTIVYVSLNVGLAIVWGILTFILNWIPNVGAMIASVAPICIIAITPSEVMNPMEKFLAMALPMCFHMFVGNFIEPKVFGKKLEMDPVIVILSLSAWGLLWGVVGMMLSVPLTAAAKIMLSHLKLWPEFVALLEGTYFARYREKKNYKKHEKDEEDFQSMEVRTDIDKERAINGGMRP